MTRLLFDDDKILTASDDTNIHVYDITTGSLRKKLQGHTGAVWAIQYEGDILVSGSTDCSVRIWGIPSRQCLHTFLGHTATVRCLVMLKHAPKSSHTNTAQTEISEQPFFITGSRDATLRVWKLPCPSDQQVLGSFSAIPSPPIAQDVNPYFHGVMTGHGNNIREIAAHGDTLISRLLRLHTEDPQRRARSQA